MLNKMLIIGNVGRDPEIRYTPSGAAVTSFTVAVNRRYTPTNGETQQETEWFDVSAWERLAEICNNYVTKGMKIYVEGRLKSRSWVGEDGQTRFRNQVIANTVTFLSHPNGATPDVTTGGYRGGYGDARGYTDRGQEVTEADGAAHGEQEDAGDFPW